MACCQIPFANNRFVYRFDTRADVTLFNIDDGAFEVLATHGDTHLGGDDFDQRVIQYYIKKMAKTDRLDISKDNHALQKLRKEVERVKRILSSQSQARLEIEDLVPGYNLSETLTRARFEGLNEDLFTKTMDPIKHVLERANLNESDIDQIVLVGGSSRIPKVRQLVSAFFNGKEISKGINPDEAVAYGAAVQGAILRSLTQDEEDAGRDRTFTIVGLSEAEIDLLIQEAKGFAEEDRLESRNGLDLYLYNLKKSLNGAVGASDGVVSAIGKNKLLENLVDETLDWMEENAAGATKHKLDRKHKEVEQVANPVMGNLYFSGGGSGPEDEEDSYDNDL
jgi:molecular chaperone DnaK (HSP70)